jgi:hypothetical protein
MSIGKWLVRGLVFAVLLGLGAGGWLYQRFTNPAAVRQQVLDNLMARMPGALVTVESAHMRLLGGIAFNRLRLARRDDPAQAEFAYFPAGVMYHDKDKLVHGRFAIRKLELPGARLHLQRGADGRWNLHDILGPVNPNVPVPTVVVQDGTLLIEDHRVGTEGASLELKDVHLTLLNDPAPLVRFRATGRCDWLGPVEVNGSWNRESAEVALAVHVTQVAVGLPLVERLAAYCPTLADHARHLEGTAAVDVDLAYQPRAPRPWTHDVRLHLTEGKCSHPQLPLPLEQLDFRARCLDGQVTVDQLSARAGGALLRLRGARVHSLDMNADLDGVLEASLLPVDAKFFDHLPTELQKIRRAYSPVGHVSLTCAFARRAGRVSYHSVIRPDDLCVRFEKFPYPLRRLTGALEHDFDPDQHLDRLRVDLQGYGTGAVPIHIQGTVNGEGPNPAVDVHVLGRDVPLDHPLRDALPRRYRKLADSFHPEGLADFHAHIARHRGVREFDSTYHIEFHDSGVRWRDFPYPLEHVKGDLDIEPGRWHFDHFHGTHQGGEVTCSGHCDESPQGDHLVVHIAGQNVLMDHDLSGALGRQPELQECWSEFSPGGRMSFQARVDCLPVRPPEVDVTVNAGPGCTIRPEFFRYGLADLTGEVRFTNHTGLPGQREVWVNHFSGRHDKTVLTLKEAHVFLKPEGGLWADIHELGGAPVLADADLLGALPPLLARACEGLGLHDPVDLRVHQLTMDTHGPRDPAPVVYWDGEIQFHDAALNAGVALEHVLGTAACRGKYDGGKLVGLDGNLLLDQVVIFRQPFRDVHTDLLVTPDQPETLRLRSLAGHLYQGTVGGQASVEFGPQVRYALDLSAVGVDLDAFGRHNLESGTQLSGLASARLTLNGRGGDLKNLEGKGRIDIDPNARLYNLPLLLDLFKVLSLRPPDGTAFEQAHAAFTIRGPRVLVNQVDLFGNSFSLRGQGEMNLNGTDINLDFYAIWATVTQMLPPVIKEIPPTVSQYLLKIKMRGDLGHVQCIKEPVPVLVEPVRALLERLGGRRSGDASGTVPTSYEPGK